MLKTRGRISFVLAVVLLINLMYVHIAFAYDAEYNMKDGNVVIMENGSYRIFATDKTSNTIYVAGDLDNVNIDVENLNIRHSTSYGIAPIEIGDNSNVKINFIGDNVLLGYNTPAIKIEDESSVLTIEGTGTLKASGGENCAGIGAGKGEKGGEIIINSGTISATGGNKAAGIGAGYNGKGANVTINGGTVTALGYGGGAGIGSGYGGDGAEVTINGGTVTTTGNEGGAGIGGGYRGSGGVININGGVLRAYSYGGGYGLGSGRYAVTSTISISAAADVEIFSESEKAPVEEDGLTTDAIVFAGAFAGSYFKTDDNMVFKIGDTVEKTVTFPAGCREIYTHLPSEGVYTVSCSDGELTYKTGTSSSSSKKNEFTITDEYQLFNLYSKCACELTEPDFTVSDIVLSTSASTKSVTLKAKGSEYTHSDSCTLHTKNQSIKYKYEILEDKAKIAEISDTKLTVTLTGSGVYTVTVRATAYIGDGEVTAYSDTDITVTKQVDALDISKDDIYITSNGIYNIKGTSKHNAIMIGEDLLDVTLVMTGVTIDLSVNTGSNKTPITVGAGSNVTLSLNGKNVLKARKDSDVIQLGYSDLYPSGTVLNIRNTGTINMEAMGKGACISGKNSSVYMFDAAVYMDSEDTAAVDCDKIFISDGSKLQARSEGAKKGPINGTFLTASQQGYKPGYVIQAILKKSIDTTKEATVTFKNSDSKKTYAVNDVTADTGSLATVIAEDGYYTAYYRATTMENSKYFTHKDNGENFREFYVSDVNTVMEFDSSQCKCKLSAPTFKVANVTMASDETKKTYTLDADDSVLKLDDTCLEHSKSTGINYTYSIVEDDNDICTLSGSRLSIEVYTAGKYKVKVRATADADGLTVTKDASFTVQKLSAAETEKKRGEEHLPYISGYPDETFRPDEGITRAETARLIMNAMNYKYADIDTNMTDVSTADWFYDDVISMEDKGYITGYEDNSFKPNNNITRAEFCVVVSRMMGLSQSSSKSKMTDVNGHWAAGYIGSLIKKKYISGYEDNTFKPDDPITRAEAVTIINAILDRTPDPEKAVEAKASNCYGDLKKSHWAYYEIMEASIKHYENDWH